MSTSAGRQAFDSLPEAVRCGILEGDALRIYAARLSVVADGDGYAWAVDTLPRDGRPEEWERVTRRIGRIVLQEAKGIDQPTRQALKAIAAVTAEDQELYRIDAWVSMDDDGGSRWTVTVCVPLTAAAFPAVVKSSYRAKQRVLKVVCSL
ncbi:MAG: hypothetical protein BWX50_00911 [Euryarchaeota archaeon ADurb.Bin009]|nr:hypothetical protein [Methanoculleus horonobensis]OQC69782.1 MAG: hypothetical protein BWX50_00911 [Euryarchaeota archaeon ADurb.Bin009]